MMIQEPLKNLNNSRKHCSTEDISLGSQPYPTRDYASVTLVPDKSHLVQVQVKSRGGAIPRPCPAEGVVLLRPVLKKTSLENLKKREIKLSKNLIKLPETSLKASLLLNKIPFTTWVPSPKKIQGLNRHSWSFPTYLKKFISQSKSYTAQV